MNEVRVDLTRGWSTASIEETERLCDLLTVLSTSVFTIYTANGSIALI